MKYLNVIDYDFKYPHPEQIVLGRQAAGRGRATAPPPLPAPPVGLRDVSKTYMNLEVQKLRAKRDKLKIIQLSNQVNDKIHNEQNLVCTPCPRHDHFVVFAAFFCFRLSSTHKDHTRGTLWD